MISPHIPRRFSHTYSIAPSFGGRQRRESLGGPFQDGLKGLWVSVSSARTLPPLKRARSLLVQYVVDTGSLSGIGHHVDSVLSW